MQQPEQLKLSSTANEYFLEENYKAAASIYQELIELNPGKRAHYWKLGLTFLLMEQEAEAQMSWMTGLMNGCEEEVEQWTAELLEILEAEATRQAKLSKGSNSWLIRQHIREINPLEINNICLLIQLSLALDYSAKEFLSGEIGLTELLRENSQSIIFNHELLLDSLCLLLRHSPVEAEEKALIKICLSTVVSDVHELRNKLLPVCVELNRCRRFRESIAIGEEYLSICPGDLEFLAFLPNWHSQAKNISKAIEYANSRIELSPSTIEEVFSRYLLIKILLGSGGHWQEAANEMEINRSILLGLEEFQPKPEIFQVLRLAPSAFFVPYIQDSPSENRELINHTALLFSREVGKITPTSIREKQEQRKTSLQQKSVQRKLKIGYVSHCLKRHSVGWIARWLIQNHNTDCFETYAYFINFDQQDPFQGWYARQFSHVCRIGIDCPDTGIDIANKISDDEIDILIDLDSITMDFSCEVMVHKPAPIQVTWLGWDASGIPQIDYYIADPYVLPEEAQSYYREKIWRLPETYVAVEGFEVEVPKISRSSLGIPQEAITYLTAQGGYKRNPDVIRLQLSVIKAVPGSFLLIKGTGSKEAIQNHFYQLAKEIGVEEHRLIFLPIVVSEEEHRANLRIADIVLDTYPYNGATTTLETLWMEIPLVTLVGQQFSARNSYTMLRNVGVEEGIAWTSNEYLEWGIRLGKDEELRKQVVWKLRESKKHAPLWDVKSFTRRMEAAYQKMWNNYISTS